MCWQWNDLLVGDSGRYPSKRLPTKAKLPYSHLARFEGGTKPEDRVLGGSASPHGMDDEEDVHRLVQELGHLSPFVRKFQKDFFDRMENFIRVATLAAAMRLSCGFMQPVQGYHSVLRHLPRGLCRGPSCLPAPSSAASTRNGRGTFQPWQRLKMADAEEFAWESQWYPVSPERDLSKTAPNK